jgi:hypothetical protein
MRERSEDTERKIKNRIWKDNQNNVQKENNNDLPVQLRDRCGLDRMIGGFSTTCPIRDYYH